MTIRSVSAIFLSLGLLSMTACVSVLPKTAPPSPRYVMSAVTPPTGGEPVEYSLVVADPTSSQLYNTTKVALTRVPNRFEFYAGTEWADRAPVLLQRALVRSLENSGRILNVGDYTTLSVSDFVLKTDMRAFHVDYVSGAPVAVVSLHAQILNNHGKIVMARNFDARQRVEKDSVGDVMLSFGNAIDQVLLEVSQWGLTVSPQPVEVESGEAES